MRLIYLTHALVMLIATAAAQQPIPVSRAEVHLELKDNRTQFQLGDIIQLELIFRDPAFPDQRAALLHRKPWEQTPGQVSANATEYGDLADDVTITPTTGWFQWQDRSGHDYRSEVPLDATGVRVSLVINEGYVFRDPGHYEITVTTHRMGQQSVTTNAVGIDITARSDAEEAALVKTLNATISNTTGQEQRTAAEQLSYLTGDDAARAKVQWLLGPDEDIANIMSNGLASTRNQALQLELVKAAWVDPEHAPDFTMQLALHRAETLASGQREPGWQMVQVQKAVSAEHREDLARVIATLPQRTGEVRRDTAYYLMENRELSPEQIALVKPVMLQEFPHMDPLEQAMLIEGRWEAVKDPSLAPFLRAMIETSANNPAAATALQRLIQIDPAAPRAYVVDMICRSERGLMLDKLNDVKDDRLPEVDQCLTALLAKGERREHDFDWEQAAQRAARFATPAILPQVKAVWTTASQDPSMLALLIRDAPKEAAALLNRKPEIEWYPTNVVYEILGAKFPTEILNWLRSPSAPKAVAAYELAQFGEPHDRALLEQRLGALRKLWLDRTAEMSEDAKSQEAELVSALLSAKAWTLTTEEKRTLTSNCLTDQCRFYAPR